jgi:hypothetical protein
MSHLKNCITFLTATFKNVTYVGIRRASLLHYVYVAATDKITHLLFSYIATTSSHVGTVRNKFHHLAVFMNSAKKLTLRRLMSYIYGALILDVSRSHTTTQHSR